MQIPQHRRDVLVKRLKELAASLEENKDNEDTFAAVLAEIRRAAEVSPSVPVGFGHYQGGSWKNGEKQEG